MIIHAKLKQVKNYLTSYKSTEILKGLELYYSIEPLLLKFGNKLFAISINYVYKIVIKMLYFPSWIINFTKTILYVYEKKL